MKIDTTLTTPFWLSEGDIVITKDILCPENEVEIENWGEYIWVLKEKFRHMNVSGGSCYYFYAQNLVGDGDELWIERSDEVYYTMSMQEVKND